MKGKFIKATALFLTCLVIALSSNIISGKQNYKIYASAANNSCTTPYDLPPWLI